MNQTQTETVYEIVRRPLIYYRISVMNTIDGMRKAFTTPIAMWKDDPCEPFDGDDIMNGETIIDNVPAKDGSYEVGIWTVDGWQILGYEITGTESSADYETLARKAFKPKELV